MDACTLKVGMNVDIQRSDGRVHSACISGISKATDSVTVEWFERGETKGKEVEISQVYALNPELSPEMVQDVPIPHTKPPPAAPAPSNRARPSSARMPLSNVPQPQHVPKPAREQNRAASRRRSNVVKEVDKIKRDREERRAKQAEQVLERNRERCPQLYNRQKKDKPARVSDDDPRCGISGAQKFDGEDLYSKARQTWQKLMQEQMREWTRRQAAEKKRQKDLQTEDDRLHDLHRREADERAMALAQAEEECRRAINEAMRDYNKSLADEQAEKARLAQQQELDDNFTEMVNHVNGDMLTENPDVAQSAFGPHRVIPDRWKGMSPEQLAEKKRIKEDEEEREKEWERQRLFDDRSGLLMEREAGRVQKVLEKEQVAANDRLTAEQISK